MCPHRTSVLKHTRLRLLSTHPLRLHELPQCFGIVPHKGHSSLHMTFFILWAKVWSSNPATINAALSLLLLYIVHWFFLQPPPQPFQINDVRRVERRFNKKNEQKQTSRSVLGFRFFAHHPFAQSTFSGLSIANLQGHNMPRIVKCRAACYSGHFAPLPRKAKQHHANQHKMRKQSSRGGRAPLPLVVP